MRMVMASMKLIEGAKGYGWRPWVDEGHGYGTEDSQCGVESK